MGAPKKIWQLLKALAVIIGIVAGGLTILFTYDMASAYNGNNFQVSSSPISSINSTHYSQSYTISFNNTALVYSFGIEVTIEIYVNTSISDVINSAVISTFSNTSLTQPGSASTIIVDIILEKDLWDFASIVIIGFNNSITGILFDYSITTISFETFQQIK